MSKRAHYPFRRAGIHRRGPLCAPRGFHCSLRCGLPATPERLDLRPDLIVGDFDSAPRPKAEHETIVLPHVKDDTDTQYAARWLLEHGYDEITLLGALGGARLEHTLANLATGCTLPKTA